MRGEAVRWVGRGLGFAIGFGIAVGLFLLAWAAAPVLALVFVSILLASALGPAIGWVRLHLPLGRSATIVLVYLAFLLAVVGMALVIVPAAARQVADFARQVPPFLASVRAPAAHLEPPTLSASVIALIDGSTAQLQRLSTPPADTVVRAGLTVEAFGGDPARGGRLLAGRARPTAALRP